MKTCLVVSELAAIRNEVMQAISGQYPHWRYLQSTTLAAAEEHAEMHNVHLLVAAVEAVEVEALRQLANLKSVLGESRIVLFVHQYQPHLHQSLADHEILQLPFRQLNESLATAWR